MPQCQTNQPESLRGDVCLPELIEGGEERGHRLKNCNRAVKVVEECLKSNPTVLFCEIDHLSVPTIGVAPDINNKARAGGKNLHQAMMRWARRQIQSLFRRKPV